MKKIFSLGIMIFALNQSPAQEIIVNGDFEEYIQDVHYRSHIPTGFNSLSFPSSWGTPNMGTPDHFTNTQSACGYIGSPIDNPLNYPCYPNACVDDNFFGNQYPRTHTMAVDGNNDPNNNYVGFLYHSEYVKQVLPYPLAEGQCYKLSYWVSRSDASGYASTVQAVLSVDNTWWNSSTTSPLTPPVNAIINTPMILETNKMFWTHEEFEFKAIGGEKYITIGFFAGDNAPIFVPDPGTPGDCIVCASSCIPAQPTLFGSCFYYLDDVSLLPVAGGGFNPTYTFTNANPVIPAGTYNGQNILLSGNNISTSGTVNFINCTVKCNSGTTLKVPFGSDLVINGTSLSGGCDNMWNGIVVQAGGLIHMNNNSVIEDALTAIDITAAYWQISNSTFNKNMQDIHMSNLNIGTGYSIKGVVFDHTQTLNIPTLTPTGKGLYGINVSSMVNYSNSLDIGGPNTADICQFLGGDYGIRSNNANVNVERCLFSGIHKVGIDFQGNNPSILRKLTVTSSSIVNSKRCILSQHRTDLTVQYSSFAGATEHAIEWDDNHDGHLLIGDLTDPTKGNTFQNNLWAAVTAWDNKSVQTDPIILATNNTDYTSIVIANNVITAPSYSGGLLIGEWTLGSYVSYHSLDISKNKITGAVKGIQIYNVRGFGGVFNNPPFTVPTTAVNQNQISISTASAPTAFGINAENTPGLSYAYNLIGSDNPQNWQNTGIRLLNSEFSEVYNNGIEAGTGISAGLDMQFSGLYCNILSNNVAGIALGYAALCPNVSFPHGSFQKAYSNLFVADQPATINIHNYASPIANNNWVWDFTVAANSPKVWYSLISTVPTNTTPNQSGFSMITSWTGAFDCPYQPGQLIVSAGRPNVHAILSDPNAQWRADYFYEVQRQITGQGNAGIVPQRIRRIINIEDAFGQGNFQLASGLLNGLNPSNIMEQNYQDVLDIFVDINFPVKRDPTQQEIQTLTTIAQQFPRNGGGAVTLARTYLAIKYNTYFRDEDLSDPKVFGIANIQTPCCLAPASGTVLTFADQLGNELTIPGATVYQDGSFSFDPYQLNYYNQQNPNTTYRIVAKFPSKFIPLDKDFKTLADWITSSPINVTLGGAKLDATSVTAVPDTVIAQNTSMQDASGNTYSIGVSTVQNADFLIQKFDPNGQLLWSKTFDGLASGNDTATCMTLDNEGSVYVAGKVWNGLHYNYQAVKYDSTGDMQWASEVEDTLERENEPTGIAVNNTDETVWMIGKCCSQSGTQYRKAKLQQCVHASSSNRVLNPIAAEPVVVSSIEYFPNPSKGNLNIMLKDPVGGILELFDLNGKLIFSQQVIQSGEIDLTGKGLVDGVYLLKFTGNGDPQFSKLVIHRN